MPSVTERLDQTLDRIRQIGAEPSALVLTQADYEELSRAQGKTAGGELSYRGLTAQRGQIGQMSYLTGRKPDGSESNFAF